MDKESATFVIEETARRHHTSADVVRREILCAAKEAMRSDRPGAKVFWNSIAPDGVLPSAEELLHIISVYCVAQYAKTALWEKK